MKLPRVMCALVVGFFLLSIPWSGTTGNAVLHHGQLVDSGGDHTYCLGCHDGIAAPDAPICTERCNYRTSHPIAKDYPPTTSAEEYTPIESLQGSGMQLIDGKITCISCHDLINQEKYHLFMSNDRSSLCFRCHRK